VKLPRDNIERALNTAKDKSSANFEVGVYEFFGVGGVGFVVNTLTDNSNRALFELKNALKKTAAKQASGGSVLFNFEQKVFTLLFNDVSLLQ
jgi:transcriptional/translational regulatory protein YebC/TACO1